MCKYKPIDSVENVDDLRTVIFRFISQKKEKFTYLEILNEVVQYINNHYLSIEPWNRLEINACIRLSLKKLIYLKRIKDFGTFYLPIRNSNVEIKQKLRNRLYEKSKV